LFVFLGLEGLKVIPAGFNPLPFVLFTKGYFYYLKKYTKPIWLQLL